LHFTDDILYEMEYMDYILQCYHRNPSTTHSNSVIDCDNETYLRIVEESMLTFVEPSANMKKTPDLFLPESHTCALALRLPEYTNTQILKQKLLYAITYCNTFDLFNNAGNTDFPLTKITSKRQTFVNNNIQENIQKLFN